MRSWLLAAGLAVAAAGVVLMWIVRSGGDAPSAAGMTGGERARAGLATDTPGAIEVEADPSDDEPERGPAPVGLATAAGSGDAGRPDRAEIEAEHAMNIKLGDQVPQRIYDAAATCYHGERGKSEVMAIDYTLRVSGGVASVEDVVMERSEWNAPALERCALAAIGAHTWPEPEMPNMVRKMQMDISLLGLIKRQPRNDDDDDDDDDDD